MIILSLWQKELKLDLAIFETYDEGESFARLIPGYDREIIDQYNYDYINPQALSDYDEINFRGHIVPITRFSFDSQEKIHIEYRELPSLSKLGNGLIDSSTLVDAYSILNNEVKAYIEKRENNFIKVKYYLSQKGYEVERGFAGSEDGEAILYRQKGKEDWHFLDIWILALLKLKIYKNGSVTC